MDLLNLFPDGLSELERQLRLYVAGAHPRQEAIAGLLERPDYPALLLAALERYRAAPERHWQVLTFEAPGDCQDRFEPGIERFGTLSRLLRHALTLPSTPWESLNLAFKGRQ